MPCGEKTTPFCFYLAWKRTHNSQVVEGLSEKAPFLYLNNDHTGVQSCFVLCSYKINWKLNASLEYELYTDASCTEEMFLPH